MLTFNVNTSSGVSTSNYDLIKATFHNEQNLVTFEKIYKTEQVKNGNKITKVQLPTLCFQRKVITTKNKNTIKLN